MKACLLILLILILDQSSCLENFIKPSNDNSEDDPIYHQVPGFEWDQYFHDQKNGEEEKLIITFPDDGPEDFAILKHSNPIPKTNGTGDEDPIDDCIYTGYLMNERDVPITVVGCALGNTFEAQILSFEI